MSEGAVEIPEADAVAGVGEGTGERADAVAGVAEDTDKSEGAGAGVTVEVAVQGEGEGEGAVVIPDEVAVEGTDTSADMGAVF